MSNCKVCGRDCANKGYTTVSGQRACSIHCAVQLESNGSDRCASCGLPVWEGESYSTRTGSLCCCQNCLERLDPDAINNQRPTSFKKNVTNNYNPPSNQNQFTVVPGMQVGGTNYALGSRGYDDIDMGPGDTEGHYAHGNPGWDQDIDDDDEDDAYGDINDQNYLNQYGEHMYVQKNDNLSEAQLKNLPNQAKGTDKPKNECHEVIHHGGDIKCEYCGFTIHDGSKAYCDNYGKKFHTTECFSNHFQGIPKPKFG